VIFSYPLSLDPLLWGPHQKQYDIVWYGKTRMLVKILRICSAVSTEYRRVTDGQTDILPRDSPRYAYALRGKMLLSYAAACKGARVNFNKNLAIVNRSRVSCAHNTCMSIFYILCEI